MVYKFMTKNGPFKILLFPYRFRQKDGAPFDLEFAVVKKKVENHWQALAGQAQANEFPMDSAIRSAKEALGIPSHFIFFQLDSKAMIPVEYIIEDQWGDDIVVIPETCYAVNIPYDFNFLLADYFESVQWLPYKEAIEVVKWDSNKTALWELKYRIISKKIRM
ncbi:MAG TPA: hypothetical protein VI754_07540 [Bacteriovoracaceae bacterium]|nr:hypothetical protein [Bacteriovoracaceae bacterium]